MSFGNTVLQQRSGALYRALTDVRRKKTLGGFFLSGKTCFVKNRLLDVNLTLLLYSFRLRPLLPITESSWKRLLASMSSTALRIISDLIEFQLFRPRSTELRPSSCSLSSLNFLAVWLPSWLLDIEHSPHNPCLCDSKWFKIVNSTRGRAY